MYNLFTGLNITYIQWSYLSKRRTLCNSYVQKDKLRNYGYAFIIIYALYKCHTAGVISGHIDHPIITVATCVIHAIPVLLLLYVQVHQVQQVRQDLATYPDQ